MLLRTSAIDAPVSVLNGLVLSRAAIRSNERRFGSVPFSCGRYSAGAGSSISVDEIMLSRRGSNVCVVEYVLNGLGCADKKSESLSSIRSSSNGKSVEKLTVNIRCRLVGGAATTAGADACAKLLLRDTSVDATFPNARDRFCSVSSSSESSSS